VKELRKKIKEILSDSSLDKKEREELLDKLSELFRKEVDRRVYRVLIHNSFRKN